MVLRFGVLVVVFYVVFIYVRLIYVMYIYIYIYEYIYGSLDSIGIQSICHTPLPLLPARSVAR